MAIKLELTKENKQIVELGLSKNNKYYIELYWESKEDLDASAIGITRTKNSRSIDGEADRILSVYNKSLPLTDGSGTIGSGSIGSSFKIPDGYMVHTGDVRKGNLFGKEPEEVIEVYLSKVPNKVNEIAFIVSIHPQDGKTFEQVKDAKLLIKEESGKVLLEAHLTTEFNTSNLVHLGSIIRNETGVWAYDASTSGINGDFNTLLCLL